jgi:hypothetical protein
MFEALHKEQKQSSDHEEVVEEEIKLTSNKFRTNPQQKQFRSAPKFSPKFLKKKNFFNQVRDRIK